jgi:hypothetical protein
MLAGESKEEAAFITYKGMASWYRKVTDENLYKDANAEGAFEVVDASEDLSGLMVDVDEFADLLISCHYKTRTKAPVTQPNRHTSVAGKK